MQRMMFTRSDLSRTGGLTVVDVRRLAAVAPGSGQVQGLQVGHYGFGDDNDLDTRLHIEGAIEDLRLASHTRNEALGIGRTFIDTMKTEAKTQLLGVAKPLLTAAQFNDFQRAVDEPAPRVVIPMLMPRAVALPPNSTAAQQAEAIRATTERMVVFARHGNLVRVVAKYALPASKQRTLMSAVQRFVGHDRLTDADRSLLLARMEGVLSDQQRDDLRAALERRPIVKQGVAAPMVAVNRVGIPQQSVTVVPPRFGVQNLVLDR
jgi:urease accessory protein UreF